MGSLALSKQSYDGRISPVTRWGESGEDGGAHQVSLSTGGDQRRVHDNKEWW
jgi:hypothetical protein